MSPSQFFPFHSSITLFLSLPRFRIDHPHVCAGESTKPQSVELMNDNQHASGLSNAPKTSFLGRISSGKSQRNISNNIANSRIGKWEIDSADLTLGQKVASGGGGKC